MSCGLVVASTNAIQKCLISNKRVEFHAETRRVGLEKGPKAAPACARGALARRHGPWARSGGLCRAVGRAVCGARGSRVWGCVMMLACTCVLGQIFGLPDAARPRSWRQTFACCPVKHDDVANSWPSRCMRPVFVLGPARGRTSRRCATDILGIREKPPTFGAQIRIHMMQAACWFIVRWHCSLFLHLCQQNTSCLLSVGTRFLA